MEDLIYYDEGVPAGIVAPSTYYEFTGDEVLINGPDGITSAHRQDEPGFRNALRNAGALVTGAAVDVAGVIGLLRSAEHSRTVSYLLCSAKRCADVIGDVEALVRSRVMIVGCGGIGSSVCMLLAGAGIRNFLLIDDDIVEKSNLNRQLFWTRADEGRKKVEVLKQALESRFEQLHIECLDSALGIDELAVLADGPVSAVVITADNPSTLAREGWKIAERCGVPVVSGGYLHHICAAFSFTPGDCTEVERLSADLEAETCFTLPSAIMPSYGPMNFSLASVLSNNLIMALARQTFGEQKTHVVRWDSRGGAYSGGG